MKKQTESSLIEKNIEIRDLSFSLPFPFLPVSRNRFGETITYFLSSRDNSRLRDTHEWRNRGRGSPTRHRSSARSRSPKVVRQEQRPWGYGNTRRQTGLPPRAHTRSIRKEKESKNLLSLPSFPFSIMKEQKREVRSFIPFENFR